MKPELKRKIELVGIGLLATAIVFIAVAVLSQVMPTVEEIKPAAEVIIKNLGGLR